MSRIAKDISSFTKNEVSDLFKVARCLKRFQGLVILAGTAQKDHGRILVITPRRSGSAAQRNKIRRRLKTIFYEEVFAHRYPITLSSPFIV